MDQWWSWLLGSIGLVGFYFSGKKIWWSWYINIGNQILWYAYAIVTEQWGFFMTATAYTIMFSWNAYKWTRERFSENEGWDFNEYTYLQEQLPSDIPVMDSFPIDPPKARPTHRFTVNLLNFSSEDDLKAHIEAEKEAWFSRLSVEEQPQSINVYMEDDFKYPHAKKITFEAGQ